MIKNYFRVALRSMFKNKTYVLINTLGLGISLACCIEAYLLFAFNLEFDSFHKKEKVANVFKFHTYFSNKSGKTYEDIYSPIALGPNAAQRIAGIESYVRYIQNGGVAIYGDHIFNEGFTFVDSTFFTMFDFPLLQGSHQAFKNKNSIFLSEDRAKRYFGNENPIGKTLRLLLNGNTEILVTVGGVVAPIPSNSTFTFSALIRFEHYLDVYQLTNDTWDSWRNPTTFVKLSSPEIAGSMTNQFAPFIKRRNEVKQDEIVSAYRLQPFHSNYNQSDIHATFVNLRIGFASMIIVGSMALLILLIACFNLTNTSIAITAKRLKEVGIRKAIGALRKQIAYQFLFETLLIITLALLVGLAVSQVLVPVFAQTIGLDYGLNDLNGLNMMIGAVILVFLTALIAGIYPALFNSGFNPVVLLKGSAKLIGTNGLTRTLVGAQFALSIIVLIAGVVFIQNAAYQETIDFGYDKDNIVNIQIRGEQEFTLLRNELNQDPRILNISGSTHHLATSSFRNPITVGDNDYESRVIAVGLNYFETMGLKITEGRGYSIDIPSDFGNSILVNRKFIENAGIKDPIGKMITLQEQKRMIIGVVENHVDNIFRSKEAEPFVYTTAAQADFFNMAIKIAPGKLDEIEAFIETAWRKVFPDRPFNIATQDEYALSGARNTNKALKDIFFFLTILGALLSVSGVFSLASLNTVKRVKEIGIRKVLGAPIVSIVNLLNKEFIIVLAIAMLLGSAGGYYLTTMLLDQLYAYHMNIGLVTVVVCSLVVFGIGMATTVTTILRAAHANPVRSLKSE